MKNRFFRDVISETPQSQDVNLTYFVKRLTPPKIGKNYANSVKLNNNNSKTNIFMFSKISDFWFQSQLDEKEVKQSGLLDVETKLGIHRAPNMVRT